MCSPLPCEKTGHCIDERAAIANALWSAEHLWLTTAHCAGAEVGRSGSGTWVEGPVGFLCGSTDYFDGNGHLRSQRACCEENCTQEGVGFVPFRGPVLRKLCDEARAGLVDAEVAMTSNQVKSVQRDDGGVVAPEQFDRKMRWLLSPGHYDVTTDDGVLWSFEVPLDTVRITVITPGLDRICTHQRCVLGKKNGAYPLTFNLGLTRADGGVGVTAQPWVGPKTPQDPNSY